MRSLVIGYAESFGQDPIAVEAISFDDFCEITDDWLMVLDAREQEREREREREKHPNGKARITVPVM